MLMDPRAALWDTDIICVVHEISDKYFRNQIDKEVLKCLYLHPEKESILIINKVDLLKQKKLLLDLVSIVTGGHMNGKKMDIEYPNDNAKKKFFDLENLYRKTAKKLDCKITEDTTESEKIVLKLIDELRQCENILIESTKQNTNDTNVTDITAVVRTMSVEKFTGQDDIVPYKTINDVTPFEFKEDLMNTTDWHL
jgi:hypothetical protein